MKEWDEISEGGCKVWEGKGKEIEWEKEGRRNGRLCYLGVQRPPK